MAIEWEEYTFPNGSSALRGKFHNYVLWVKPDGTWQAVGRYNRKPKSIEECKLAALRALAAHLDALSEEVKEAVKELGE